MTTAGKLNIQRAAINCKLVNGCFEEDPQPVGDKVFCSFKELTSTEDVTYKEILMGINRDNNESLGLNLGQQLLL